MNGFRARDVVAPRNDGGRVASPDDRNHPISDCLPVIASTAKQSRIPPGNQSGLLRRKGSSQ
ncbi:hypothetical protein NK6_6989 [Bradyrhizobium diazoefficiens]|uniref:Uncharacterized protein n=1 Tax=Bradyrhizobium diazoefficiens TaxID=1355477 RepID=A0A0E3VW19_9BRAD|nr:hypothetical protein NK6_6989 [Bradyrhizobium diazoefficiens]